jgi:hypothetical protein
LALMQSKRAVFLAGFGAGASLVRRAPPIPSQQGGACRSGPCSQEFCRPAGTGDGALRCDWSGARGQPCPSTVWSGPAICSGS